MGLGVAGRGAHLQAEDASLDGFGAVWLAHSLPLSLQPALSSFLRGLSALIGTFKYLSTSLTVPTVYLSHTLLPPPLPDIPLLSAA